MLISKDFESRNLIMRVLVLLFHSVLMMVGTIFSSIFPSLVDVPDKQYAEYYLNARKYNNIISRSLWEKKPNGRKLTAQEIHECNPRFLPESMHGKFKSMMILFDDKVAIVSPLEKLSAILITSKEIHQMLAMMFESIWNVSEEYK